MRKVEPVGRSGTNCKLTNRTSCNEMRKVEAVRRGDQE
jgi:hypothetical protein